MKNTSEQKSKSLGTDESVAAQEFDNRCRKEKKEKRKDRKKSEVHTDAMMTSNEQRVGEKQKIGKKRHKEDVMIEDDDKGQEEIQKKKKRKKDKNDIILNGYGDDRETEKKKNKKKDHMVSFDEDTEVKDTEEEEETAAVEVEDERSSDREKVKMDATKADNDAKKKKKRRKETKTKVDKTADVEEHKNTHATLEKEKKQNVKERGDEVEDGGETNGSKQKKKERKKRKDDVAVGDEEHKEKVKEKKQSVKESGDEVVDCKETNGYKEKNKKRKEENNGDNLTAGDEEQKKKVKEKKGNAAVHEGNRSGNEGEHLKGRRDEGKKRKSNTDDRGRAANSDPSEHPTPRTRKVSFSDKVKVFDLADSETADKDDNLVWGKRFTREEDEAIMNSVHEYIETHHLGEEGLYMILHCKKFPKIRGCWEEIAAALPHRPALSIYYRGHNLFERGDNKWTKEEMELVKESYEKHGRKYKLIAEELGKHRVHVKDAVRRLQFADANRGRWTQEEYQNLYDLVSKDLQMKLFEEKKSKHGMLRDNICWGAISTQMKTRLFSSCCDKWYKQLRSPMVVEGTWADADDYRLLLKLTELDASCEDEVDWDYLLEHRSGDLSRKRWKQMVDHLGENGNKSFSEQVEVLSKRYCPDLLEVREALDARPVVD